MSSRISEMILRGVTYHTYGISYICTAVALLPSTPSTINALKATPELRNIASRRGD
jgi:hypothetical protein